MSAAVPEVDALDLALVVDALDLLSKAVVRCSSPDLMQEEAFVSLLGQVDGIVEQVRGRNGFDEQTSFVL